MKIVGFILILVGVFFGTILPPIGGVFIIPGIFMLIFGKTGTQKAIEKQNELLEQQFKK
jgi:sulfite exporter TauE/SafE